MKKEVQKYPYNATTEDEIKIFLSDQICEQVVSIIYRNRQFFCTIKDRMTDKKKSNYNISCSYFRFIIRDAYGGTTNWNFTNNYLGP